MRKLIWICAVLTALCLTACGGAAAGTAENAGGTPASTALPTEAVVTEVPTPAPDADAVSTVNLADARAEMLEVLAQAGVTDTLPVETDALSSLYGIDPSWVAQSASFVTMSGVFPDEVILVEATDEDAAARVAEKLESRLEEVLNQAKSYDADSYAAAQLCKVRTSGRFVYLILSASADTLAEICGNYVG